MDGASVSEAARETPWRSTALKRGAPREPRCCGRGDRGPVPDCAACNRTAAQSEAGLHAHERARKSGP